MERAIPVQSVDADQMPRERGWSYDELATIVGSLYLDSHHSMRTREEQFRSVSEEYKKEILRLQNEAEGMRKQIDALNKELGITRRELDGRARTSVTSGSERQGTLSDNT
jgi:predicted RNase H-like nuclease (RuvC/YqgF family)